MISYRDFEPALHPGAQRALYKDCFPDPHLAPFATDAHYDWKFHSYPASPPSIECAAWDDDNGELLGYYAAIPYKYRIASRPDREVTCGMVCDVMTHSKARGRGIFTGIGRYSLARFTRDGVGFTTGYPIRPEVLPGHLKVGWKVAFDLPLHVRVLRTRAAARAGKVGWLSPLGDLVAQAYALPLKLARPRRAGSLVARAMGIGELLALPEYDAFVHRWTATVPHALVKSRAFMKWRLSAPGSHYRAVTAWNGRQLEAVAITRRLEFSGLPCLVLLDLMSATPDAATTDRLHDAIEAEALASGGELVVSMMSRHSARRARMLRNGYLRGPVKFQLILNTLDPSLPEAELLDERNWNLMWIDSDDN